MEALPNDIGPSIEQLCTQYHGIKLWAYLKVRYESANPLDIPFKSFEPFLPASHIILYDINHSAHDPQYNPHARQLKTIIERLLASNAKYIREKSGLVLSEILYLNIHWIRYAPLSGSAWSPLPKFLQNKKAILNVKNNDNRCFAYAIAAAFIQYHTKCIHIVQKNIKNFFKKKD